MDEFDALYLDREAVFSSAPQPGCWKALELIKTVFVVEQFDSNLPVSVRELVLIPTVGQAGTK